MIILLFVCLLSFNQESVESYVTELEGHINWWLRNVRHNKEKRRIAAFEMIPYIIDHCEKYNVDPLRIAVLASEENSWYQNGKGKAGEIGPLQVHPKWFREHFDLTTVYGQLEAGVAWLSEGIQKCKTGVGAYHYYRFAQCPKIQPYSGALRRERLYQSAVRRHRRGGK